MRRRHMKILARMAALAVLFPTQALAQSAGPPGLSMTLPGSSSQACVQVQIAGQKPSVYNCLNQQLEQQVEGAGGPSTSAPLTATSSSNQVGTFNEQGVAEQYGQNFGKSAVPYRPPIPVFNNHIGPTQ